MKKIMLSLVLGILVLGFVAASMSGMAVSVSEKEAKAFSFQEKDYSVEVQNQDDGTVDLEINGKKVEGIEEGDVLMMNGAEVEVKNVRKPWLFRRSYKVDLNVMETENTQAGVEARETYRGLLAEKSLAAGMDANSLKGYEVKYDGNGKMVYEITRGSTELRVGENYEISEDPEDPSVRIAHPLGEDPLEAAATGSTLPFFTWRCGCPIQYAQNGNCHSSCNWVQYPNGNVENCQGGCTGDLCASSSCVMGPTGIAF